MVAIDISANWKHSLSMKAILQRRASRRRSRCSTKSGTDLGSLQIFNLVDRRRKFSSSFSRLAGAKWKTA